MEKTNEANAQEENNVGDYKPTWSDRMWEFAIEASIMAAKSAFAGALFTLGSTAASSAMGALNSDSERETTSTANENVYRYNKRVLNS